MHSPGEEDTAHQAGPQEAHTWDLSWRQESAPLDLGLVCRVCLNDLGGRQGNKSYEVEIHLAAGLDMGWGSRAGLLS